MLDEGFPEDAASRTYYAVFQTARALLRSEDVWRRKHSAVEAALAEVFVRPGRLEERHFQTFLQTRRLRETADYEISPDLAPESVAQRIEQAAAFLDRAEQILGAPS